MSEPLILNKFSLVVTTRCNLKCKLCDEFIPANKPFPDMTVRDERRLLDALFEVAERVRLLHLSGGGEPFLNESLAEMIDAAFEYEDKFDHLMTFTNSTVVPPAVLLAAFSRHKSKLVVQASDYGITPEKSAQVHKMIEDTGATLRVNKYYGENQDFSGWVDFGSWDSRKRSDAKLEEVFRNCGITRHMQGNWRTRDGKSYWCQRAQRGTELGLLPDCAEDYVDILGFDSPEDKRAKFRKIMNAAFLSACDNCSGDHGTTDKEKRYPAGEQMEAR